MLLLLPHMSRSSFPPVQETLWIGMRTLGGTENDTNNNESDTDNQLLTRSVSSLVFGVKVRPPWPVAWRKETLPFQPRLTSWLISIS